MKQPTISAGLKKTFSSNYKFDNIFKLRKQIYPQQRVKKYPVDQEFGLKGNVTIKTNNKCQIIKI